MVSKKSSISVYSYTDHRKYLRDYYVERKSANKNFSYRFFAKQAGINSVGLYKDVVESRRDLGRGLILKFANGIGLNQKETEYFESMVFFNEVKPMEEREFYFKKMMASYESKAFKVDSTKYEYYSKWYHSAIMALVSYYRFKDNFKELAKKLNPSITMEQARNSILILEKLNIIEKEKNGIFGLVHSALTAKVEDEENRIKGLNIINFQKTMLEMAGESYSNNDIKDLDMSTLTLSISESTYLEFKKELNSLRKKFSNMAKRDDKPDRVYQLNCNLYPLTKISRGQK